MSKHFFTFGFGQKHEHGYHVIEAEDVGKAETEMVHRFGSKWSMHYNSAEEAGVEEYGLHEVFLMFEVEMSEDDLVAMELTAEFRTLSAARIYTVDCVKSMIALQNDPRSILGEVRDPKGELVWRVRAEVE